LVLPHYGTLCRSALRLAGSQAEAEDLVQETLLRAYRAHERLTPESQVRPWLMRILYNTFVSVWRRRKREQRLLQPSLFEHDAPWLLPSPPVADHPDNPLAALDDQVVEALEELPPNYRRCVMLVDVEDKTYKEAADAIGRPVGTVMSRLFRGRRLLQDKLDGYAREVGFLPPLPSAA
jgi:RNA polymerase sigma-70 factor (ECF subfamily)